VADPEDLTKEMPDGEVGVLLAKGPGVMKHGYWNDPKATKAAFVDGYFITGTLCSCYNDCGLLSCPCTFLSLCGCRVVSRCFPLSPGSAFEIHCEARELVTVSCSVTIPLSSQGIWASECRQGTS
jgi:acyl-CoA synthetase (AMP-forming)/AMP-acid ligase II